MRLIPWFAAVTAAIWVQPAAAQVLTTVQDTAFWCEAVLTDLRGQGSFPDLSFLESVQAVGALIEAQRGVQQIGSELGLTAGELESLRQSYRDEATVQVADYRAMKDPVALRLELRECYDLVVPAPVAAPAAQPPVPGPAVQPSDLQPPSKRSPNRWDTRTDMTSVVWCATALRFGYDAGVFGIEGEAFDPAAVLGAIDYYEQRIVEVGTGVGQGGEMAVTALRHRYLTDFQGADLSAIRFKLDLSACAIVPPAYDHLVGNDR